MILEYALHRLEQVGMEWQGMLQESLAVFHEVFKLRNVFELIQGTD